MGTSAEQIIVEGKKYKPLYEGLASILTPVQEPASSLTKKSSNTRDTNGDQQVFYNPVQQFNRDLSVLAILIYGQSACSAKTQSYENGPALRRKKKKQNAKQRDALLGKSRGESDHSKSQATLLAAEEAAINTEHTVEDQNKRHETVVESPELRGCRNDTACSAAGEKKRKRNDSDPDADERENATSKKQRAENTDVHDGLSSRLPNGERPQSDREDGVSANMRSAKQSEEENQVEGAKDHANGTNEEVTKNDKVKTLPFSILDALSATGLRALRYAKEIPFATHIIANDLSHDAINAIKLNINHNEVQGVVRAHAGDARTYMYQKIGNGRDPDVGGHVHRFDVIDLDPYGTAVPFLDAAIQALKDGGLLCVTCTDSGVWASNGYPEKSFSHYGGVPLKGFHSHEGGLRMILHAVAVSAARYGIGIEPLLSLSVDFYARLFIRIHKRQADVKLLANKTMIVYNCDHGCTAWTTQKIVRSMSKENRNGDEFFKHSYAQAPTTTPTCEHCGFKTHLSGPMWAGPLHNPNFIQRILDILPTLDKATYPTIPRIEGVLTVALEEDLDLQATPNEAASPQQTQPQTSSSATPLSAPIPEVPPSATERHPFYVSISSLARVLHTSCPSEDAFRGALRHLGYRVTRSHCKPASIRTDAPFSVLWEVMREWIRQKSPIRESAVKEGTAGWEIMRRMRGSEARSVEEMKEGVGKRLKAAKTKADLKSELEAALFRLGRGAAAGEDDDSAWAEELRKLGKLDVVFDENLGREKKLKQRLLRYQMNPAPNWGPMNKASGGSAAKK